MMRDPEPTKTPSMRRSLPSPLRKRPGTEASYSPKRPVTSAWGFTFQALRVATASIAPSSAVCRLVLAPAALMRSLPMGSERSASSGMGAPSQMLNAWRAVVVSSWQAFDRRRESAQQRAPGLEASSNNSCPSGSSVTIRAARRALITLSCSAARAAFASSRRPLSAAAAIGLEGGMAGACAGCAGGGGGGGRAEGGGGSAPIPGGGAAWGWPAAVGAAPGSTQPPADHSLERPLGPPARP